RARPPAFSTAVAMASESVATTTGPTAAASARRRTCTTMGKPAISASGLPGSRLEAMRAGVRTSASDLARGGAHRPQVERLSPGYTVARHEANRLSLRPPSLARHARRAAPARCFTVSSGSRSPSMNSFELNKILGAILGTCLFLLALNIAAGAMFAPRKPAKPGYDIAVVEQPAGGGGAAAAPPQEEPSGKRHARASPQRGGTP